MASSKKNDNDQNYDLMIVAPGVITVQGLITHFSETTVMINRRRDGSSKRQIEAIPRDNIIFVKGSLDEGSEATVIYRDEKAPAARKMRKVRIEGTDKKTGFISGQSEDGSTILINPLYSKLVTSKETEVEAPNTETKKKSSKKSGDKEKKKS